MPDSDPGADPFPEHDTLPPEQDPEVPGGIQDPPTTWTGRLGQIGPGLIIAAAIVGSGELIATTKTGAQAGIALLWLVIIGCVLKTFVQIEFGRQTITHGETTLAVLDQVPGPRIGVNWIVWFWVLMTMCGVAQLGGIVGGVGQSLALTIPFSGDYEDAIAVPSGKRITRYVEWRADLDGDRTEFDKLTDAQQERVLKMQAAVEEDLATAGEAGAAALAKVEAGENVTDPYTWDDRIWASIVACGTAVLLYFGRYSVLQRLSLVLVGSFTLITIANVIVLQTSDEFAIPWATILSGLTFRLPTELGGTEALTTALATFGIIGVGAAELISYPYWCLEKGYAKYTGKRNDSDAWANRARGWVKVMTLDAFASMTLFTIATLMFFLMGVAVLHSEGRDPEGMRMVATIARSYDFVFGQAARWLFLVGAIAVLYSTYLAANAANTRMFTDGLKMLGVIDRHKQSSHDRSVKAFSITLPLLCAVIYVAGADPVKMILLSGLAQLAMLPILAGSALYFSQTKTDPRLKPGRLWFTLLVASSIGLMIVGAWGIYSKLS